MLKAIHAQEDRQAAQQKGADVVAKLRAMKLAKAASIVEVARVVRPAIRGAGQFDVSVGRGSCCARCPSRQPTRASRPRPS